MKYLPLIAILALVGCNGAPDIDQTKFDITAKKQLDWQPFDKSTADLNAKNEAADKAALCKASKRVDGVSITYAYRDGKCVGELNGGAE